MKARDLKNIKPLVKIGHRKFYIQFNFNSMCVLEEVFPQGLNAAIRNMQTNKKVMSTLRALIYSAIKPGYPSVTINEIGELLSESFNKEDEWKEINEKIMEAIQLFLPTDEQVDEVKEEGE